MRFFLISYGLNVQFIHWNRDYSFDGGISTAKFVIIFDFFYCKNTSAEGLANDLNAYLSGEPVSARSGGFTQVIVRVFRETHHAPLLENWGLLWMWHSVVLLGTVPGDELAGLAKGARVGRTCGFGPADWPFGADFWALRRRAGPVTFIERQIAHLGARR